MYTVYTVWYTYIHKSYIFICNVLKWFNNNIIQGHACKLYTIIHTSTTYHRQMTTVTTTTIPTNIMASRAPTMAPVEFESSNLACNVTIKP